jgi:hypothetical protein
VSVRKIASFFGFLKIRPFLGEFTLKNCGKLSTSEHAKEIEAFFNVN